MTDTDQLGSTPLDEPRFPVPGRRAAAASTVIGYTVNTLIVSAQAVLLVPLYISALGPRLYGSWLASGEVLVWMQALDLGIPNLLIQRVGAAHGRGDERAVGEWFASSALVIGIVACAVGGLGAALSFLMPRLFDLSVAEAAQLQGAFLVGSVAVSGVIASNIAVGLSRGVQDTSFMNAVVVAASVASLVTSLVLIEHGFGLWAIAFGLVVRALVMLVGAAVFIARSLRRGLHRFVRLRRAILRECLLISPLTALGGISYTVMNQSETFLIATLLRPELAVVYAVTRKAAEVGRGLVDVLGAATYGGFAHLVASSERHRSLRVLTEVTSLRTSIAVVMAGAYVAVNASLVATWVGPAQYGGLVLTALIALQSIVLGSSYLVNSLYRALGNVARGSFVLIVEMAIRIPLMAISLVSFGLPALPVAGIITAATSGALVSRWTHHELARFAEPARGRSNVTWAIRAVVFGAGLALAYWLYAPTWAFVLFVGSSMAVIGGGALLVVDPNLSDIRRTLRGILARA